MKWVVRILYVLGFTFTYTLPFVLFGRVIPYTKEGIGKSLTTCGILALCIFAFIVIGKIKDRIKEWKKGAPRALVLLVLRAVPVVIITIFMRWLEPFITSMISYWYDMLFIIPVGWIFDVAAEILESNIPKEEDK